MADSKKKSVFLKLVCSVVLLLILYGLYEERGLFVGETTVHKMWFEIPDVLYDIRKARIQAKVEISKRLEERAMNITRMCARLKKKMEKIHQNLNNLRYLRDNKILYCPIEKIASTFWQKILYIISNPDVPTDSFNVPPNAAYSNSKYYRIRENDSLADISEESVSFLFVRDPFTRLFSAWLDKVFSVNIYYWWYGKKIIHYERRNVPRTSVKCGNDVSFKEFVSYITQEILSGKKVDKHFSPSVAHCNVCELNFTYIGKYETLEEDAKFIVNTFRDGNRINIEQNFVKKSVLAAMKDSANFIFHQKNLFRHCLSKQCALYRVWMRLVCRGVIGKEIRFPYLTPKQANKVTLNSFTEDLIKAHGESDPRQLVSNRNEALVEAFMSLDNQTFNSFLEAYEFDFNLFGYSRKPKFLQHFDMINHSTNSTTTGFKYLQDCPFLNKSKFKNLQDKFGSLTNA